MALRVRGAMAATIVVLGTVVTGSGERTVSLPMSIERNPQFGTNSYEPARLHRPYLTVRLSNPITRDARISAHSWIDTAADHCFMSQSVARALRVKLSTQSPVLVHTPAGPVTMHAAEVDYELLDGNGVVLKDFPRTRTHFYVNPRTDAPYDVVLGQVGFLDQIGSITLDFRRRLIVLGW